MKFGLSWWGKNWLNALRGVDLTNRIPRGKTYANTGRVYDLEIKDNVVSAKVKGRSYDYYDVKIKFRKFSKKHNEIIVDTIKNNEYILSSLLNHKLPKQLHEALYERGIQVFPTSIEYITPRCDCPDYAYICKHIAGVIYMISHEVDKDPFQVFKLQGCDLLKLLDYNQTGNNIKTIEQIFTNKDDLNDKNYDEPDFSKINDLKDSIFLLLNDYPLFFEKNFKTILNSIYVSFERFTKKSVENYERYQAGGYEPYMRFSGLTYTMYDKKEEDVDDWLDNTFLNSWNYPNQWETLTMNINDKYELDQITTGNESLLTKHPHENVLFAFLTELNHSGCRNINHNLELMNLIYQFTIELIKKHAIIPELFESNNNYYIRWIPAVFDRHVNSIIENLAHLCPEDLLTFNKTSLSRKDQIITISSIFIKGLMHNYLQYGITQGLRKLMENSVIRLFLGEARSFSKFDESGYENLINQWLSKFVLNSREYDLYLVINEDEEIFRVDVEVDVDNTGMKNIQQVIDDMADDNIKLQLLSDIYIINEVFPEVNNILNITEIEYSLDEFSNFFMNTLPLFEILGLNIVLPKNLRKVFKPKLSLEIAANTNEKSYLTFKDIVKFNWKVVLGNTDCSVDEFKQLTEKSKGLVKIANEYVILDENETKTLIKQIQKLPQKLNKNELLKAVLSKQTQYASVEVDDNINEMLANINKKQEITLPEDLNANLRPYQEVGYSWLVQNINTGFGSILADDMGLGKTLQVLTTALYLKNEGMIKKDKILVVAPTSLLTNWQQEINRFTPTLTSYIYHGSSRKFPKKEYDIYLTSYGVIRRDIKKFNERKWLLTVVDEAQNIKNPNTQQTIAVKSIKSKNKIALSGTPVENRLSEYWSIFDFINKGYLTTLKKFRQNYILPIEKEHDNKILDNFKQITQPFILRRLKTDKNIINDLPDKITNDIYCGLTKNQTALYKQVLETIMKELDEADGIQRKGIVLKLINALKQICNHPSQYTKSKKYAVEESGKMEVLIDILANIVESKEKVLIFTQYVEMGNIMKDLIKSRLNEEVLFLHGSLSRSKRDNLVKRFQSNSQTKIFIISLKAGGTGLNLTAASNVIHYDLWWNPAVENQATDRAYRIGQESNVMVYRFITNGTFEEKINEMIQDKKELAEITVGNGEKFITEMNDDELKKMLTLRKT